MYYTKKVYEVHEIFLRECYYMTMHKYSNFVIYMFIRLLEVIEWLFS